MTEPPGPSGPSAAPAPRQHAAALTLSYVLARFGIFGVLVGLFWVIGFRGLPGLLAAAILSIPVSYVALRGLRERVALRLAERREEKLAAREEFRQAGADDD